ncbi:MAG: ArsA family ATPase [Candidatus Koribacter versatilis]|uniref:arsenite-transporting ATPase n=1 Tax=Candidatus Korobacter versatilis TaxID=658062 RepID=A0A932EPM8_9BACT|nr:ArsA family ATPase [Candidatus Koribacter versatilis]
MATLAFFVGKGGVGKTTLSAAYAAQLAAAHPRERVLLLSTDPAHSTADVLQLHLGGARTPVRTSRGRLSVWQVAAEKQFQKFLAGNRKAILALVESGTIFSSAEIEPLLDTTLPGMAEMAALLAIHDLLASDDYGHIVVDTAPIGHTLRLFEMPEHFAKFLDFLDVAAGRDQVLAAHFGGRARPVSQPFITEWRQMVEAVRAALADAKTQVTLVTTSETFSLHESVRVAKQMRDSDSPIALTDVVLNKVVEPERDCDACRRRARATAPAKAFLRKHFRGLPVHVAPDPGHPILGAAQLAAFGAHVFQINGGDKRPLRLKTVNQRSAATGRLQFGKTRFTKTKWPKLSSALAFTLGKGGVGKTTVSAALAFHARATEPRVAVTVCSTDPAPSLEDVFEKPVDDRGVAVLGDAKFRAMELDAVGEFRQWAARMKRKLDEALHTQVQGVHVDMTLDREIFSALLDIVPPGVDELFAIFRILDLLDAKKGKVVVDMAPTGHALDLLRMPDRMLLWSRLLLKSLAPHRTLPLAREVAVEVATIGQRVRELAQILRDPKRARLWVVMLAEPLPDRETRRLLAALEELKVAPAAIFVNRVLFPEDVQGCRRGESARAWQLATLARMRTLGKAAELFVVRDFGREIQGKQALASFTRELWRMA